MAANIEMRESSLQEWENLLTNRLTDAEQELRL
jgi:hypothetical protein